MDTDLSVRRITLIKSIHFSRSFSLQIGILDNSIEEQLLYSPKVKKKTEEFKRAKLTPPSI